MGGAVDKRHGAPMTSVANWALLGLIIERSSYVYELAQRFERTYGSTLTLSDLSHAYKAISTLAERGLVEEIPGTHSARQPKPHYRATTKGLDEYHDWLIGQVAVERRQQKIVLLQLIARRRDPQQTLALLDEYEQACLADTCATPLSSERHGLTNGAELQARLISEQKRLAVGAQIEWCRFARNELKAFARSRGGQT